MISVVPKTAYMQRIESLPADVCSLIAAGEVIDSLAAVVRELAENALDAGATRIMIGVWPEQWRVRLADNGTGMDLENLQKCARAHTTSKIHNREDLWKIKSLGFRGEALHSLAQLSSLEICSRVSGEAGWRVFYNNLGEALETEPAAIAPGTIVTVSDLFGNWQARRAGLPTPAQQLRAVQLMVHNLALCYPGVMWQIEQNERRCMSLSPGVNSQHIAAQLLRDVKLQDLQYHEVELGQNQGLEIVIGLPDRCHRHRLDWVKFAINGRLVKNPEIEQTLLTCFARTLPRDRYPVCFLHLRVSPEQIDWNRHPAKAEIYLHNMAEWQAAIASGIAEALQLSNSHQPEAGQQKVGKLLKASEQKGGYAVNRSIEPAPKESISERLQLRAVAQIHNTYILAEHPTGLWLIEQHIAHERVLYEEICERWRLINLEKPVILNQLSETQLENLQKIGIEIDPFGDQLWAARKAPEMLASRDDCAEAILEISQGDLQAAQVATACRSAIRNGTTLSLAEMQILIERWQNTKNPRTCPHGRPIYLALEETALSRFFRRHWVLGKSHGI
ncbi:DNA mismatch repair endonuclease MutL [Ancylothrix sp. D3o]|uniref:DNA mismatch repair endonuclease MutL n=1 Tax=Ancylothrix sp. D3o TaxID=2953691 RepID=UPI0021BB55B2|nr:DNA mismatch repair endonuclease MutL [Ancylothrix sp. D3o]